MIQTTLAPGVAWPEYVKAPRVRRDISITAIYAQFITALNGGAVTSNAISKKLGIGAPYASKRLRQMEKLGLVAREQIPRKDGVTEYKWRVL